MDTEIIADRRIESAARHARESNRHLFVAGYQAAKVYGKHEEYATKEIALRAGRSIAAVQAWVEGYRAFILCYETNPSLARKLRRQLTITHFRRIYALQLRYSMTGDQCLYFLSLMLVSKQSGECYGPDAMEQEIDTDMRYAGIKPDTGVQWQYHFQRLLKPLETLKSFDGELPAPVRRWILDGLRLFE